MDTNAYEFLHPTLNCIIPKSLLRLRIECKRKDVECEVALT